MSDIRLFQLTQGQARELQGDASDLENPLQALKHLRQQVFGGLVMQSLQQRRRQRTAHRRRTRRVHRGGTARRLQRILHRRDIRRQRLLELCRHAAIRCCHNTSYACFDILPLRPGKAATVG